jgi:hypothetical protein
LAATKKPKPNYMQTKFVEIDLPRSQLPHGQVVPAAIETLLSAWGEPLRWAITRVDPDFLHIEATLTINEPTAVGLV